MYDAFECVLQLLLQPVGLQDVDNADVEQQALALLTPCWNATRSGIGLGRRM